MESLNKYVAKYKAELAKGDIQKAYEGLLKYVLKLKAYFEKRTGDRFSVGNSAPGYMDFTYFPFFDTFLREHKLRFGIVLNHKELQFELWLMGQNADVQTCYWDILKSTKWNKHRPTRPQYSVLEVVLADNPDFGNTEELNQKIVDAAISNANEIIEYLKNNESK